jgi:hypothetical protein
MSDPVKKLNFLGDGIPTYFYIIIFMTAFMTLMYIFSGIFS